MSGRAAPASRSPACASPIRNSAGPTSSSIAMSATSSAWTWPPHVGNSVASTDARPSVTPACEISPVHTYAPIWRSMPDALRPAATPIRSSAMRIATSATAIQPYMNSVRSGSDAPVATKKTTSTGSAPRWSATFSASPCGTAAFWITMPADIAASSGSKPCVAPTWFRRRTRPAARASPRARRSEGTARTRRRRATRTRARRRSPTRAGPPRSGPRP